MTIDWSHYLPFLKDAGERSAKTFAQAFLAVAGIDGLGSDFAAVAWSHAAEAGALAVIFSWLSSIASLKFGAPGTASLTKAVRAAFRVTKP